MQNHLVFITSDNPTTFFGYGSIVCLLLIELLSIIVLITNLKDLGKSRINLILLFWLLYVVLNTMVNSNDFFSDIREVIWWPLVFYLFYFIAYNDVNRHYINKLLKMFPILFMVLVVQYVYIRSTNFVFISISGREVFAASNLVFFIGLLLPFAFLLKTKKTKYLILIIGGLAILISFKRSAIIFASLVLLTALYFDFIKNKKTNVFRGVLAVITVGLISIYSFNYLEKNTGGFINLRFISMESDRGSGRLDIFENVWSAFKDKNMVYQAFGSGHNSVIKDGVAWDKREWIKVSAHNDFLEVLYDFGFLGFFVYLLFVFRIVKLIRRLNTYDDKYFQANIAAFIIFIVMSAVSHLIVYPTYYAYLVIIWAITEGQLSTLRRLQT